MRSTGCRDGVKLNSPAPFTDGQRQRIEGKDAQQKVLSLLILLYFSTVVSSLADRAVQLVESTYIKREKSERQVQHGGNVLPQAQGGPPACGQAFKCVSKHQGLSGLET